MSLRPIPSGAASRAHDSLREGKRPIDLIHLARQTHGDRDLEIELLGLFRRQAAQIMDRLSADLPGNNIPWRADLAHTLKGSARAIGATRVAIKAEIYEVQARDGKPDLNPALTALRSAVDEACGAIGDLLRAE
ncbi:MAG TPA: Hpt domain-containing protein [Beijerinckiaceae bacterium]|jgi:HPt (histidine-containing phosphotransfer) domain-containing protein|nr:Hpt domain-containing protein [Beijerinckiaceae bacterium]